MQSWLLRRPRRNPKMNGKRFASVATASTPSCAFRNCHRTVEHAQSDTYFGQSTTTQDFARPHSDMAQALRSARGSREGDQRDSTGVPGTRCHTLVHPRSLGIQSGERSADSWHRAGIRPPPHSRPRPLPPITPNRSENGCSPTSPHMTPSRSGSEICPSLKERPRTARRIACNEH